MATKNSVTNTSNDSSELKGKVGNPTDKGQSEKTSTVAPAPDVRAGGDGGVSEVRHAAAVPASARHRSPSLRSDRTSHHGAPSFSGTSGTRGLLTVPGASSGAGADSPRATTGLPRVAGAAAGGRRPTLTGYNFGQRRSSRQRRRRNTMSQQPGRAPHEQYKNAVAVAHAAIHWRWRAQPRRYLSTGGERDPELPEDMQPEVPEHSRWLWNFKEGDLFWRSAPDNPVETFYQTSLGEEAIKRQIGLFGRRYKRYPNAATVAVPETGRHLFARAISKVVDREAHVLEGKVSIDDVKAVAEVAVGQFFPTAFGRRRFSEMPRVNHFLLSLIEYFHHYFNERKMTELAKQHNCLVFDEAGVAERRVRMKDCLLDASRSYANFILGRGMPFHHTNEGAFGTISASSADRQFWEAFYAFTIQVMWITFGRPDPTVILRETGRIFRTLYLDPARREAEGSTGKYRNALQRRDALLMHVQGKSGRRSRRAKRPTNASELASHNYLAMCVAMARVYGTYDCPPMPPKPIYGLLKNRSTFVDDLITEDPHRRRNTRHAVEQEAIGILGHPRREFDDNLDPIDLPREAKFRQLKFLGPISERTEKTRIAAVTPYLLLPTLPSAADLEKYT